MNTSEILNKVWNYAHVLRDDGVGYGDYVEQITYLLFLKMAAEREQAGQETKVPAQYAWDKLVKEDGDALEEQYRRTLESLGKLGNTLGTIFRKAQNKIQDPAKLERLIKMIDKEQWSTLPMDVKGAIYEGLLERNAQDVRGGAGQYFTPRPLIRAIVAVMRPRSTDTVADPACGTGGFLLAAHDYMAAKASSKKAQRHLKDSALRGTDIVDGVVRLCAMNLHLHGIGGDACPVNNHDSLAKEVGDDTVDMVLANPPFGNKSSITVVNAKTGKRDQEKLRYERTDFWASTSNKQLNFVQHVVTMIGSAGKAAVVVPDNVLFEGGAGETVRKNLLERCELHTLLRLPTGIFYAQGVKANVLFFDAKPAAKSAWTKTLWVYDYRTNVHKTLKENTLEFADFQDFIRCYQAEDRSRRRASWKKDPASGAKAGLENAGRWRAFAYDELIARDKTNLDIFWLKDETLKETEELPPPDVLAREIVVQLETALADFRQLEDALATKRG